MALLSSIRSSLDRDKRKVQVTKLDEFTYRMPELGEISEFRTSWTRWQGRTFRARHSRSVCS